MSDRPSFCQYCGNPLAVEAVFCSKCGKQVPSVETASTQPPVLPVFPSIPPVLPPNAWQAGTQQQPKSSSNWQKIIAFSLVGVVVLLSVIVISSLVSKSAKKTLNVIPTEEPIMTEALLSPTVMVEITTEEPTVEPTEMPTLSAEDFATAADVPSDWDQLAKDSLRIDYSQDNCYYSPTADYYFYGTVTNMSDKYSIENIMLQAELYASDGNLLMIDKGLPDAMVIGPGSKANFWLWVSYRQVINPMCKVVVDSASIAP